MQLAVKNGSLIKNGNDLSGGCGGGGGPSCGDCRWADDIYDVHSFVVGGLSISTWYRWRKVVAWSDCGGASWNPGYPAALAGTLWIIALESFNAESAVDFVGSAVREAECKSYKVWQCQSGTAVDITLQAVTFPDFTTSHPGGHGVGDLTNSCADYRRAFDYVTGEFTRACPEQWIPESAATLPPIPMAPAAVLLCGGINPLP